MLARIHTVAALALVALVPLAPLGIWAYARLASVDRGEALALTSRLLRSVPAYPGARLIGRHDYPQRAWDGESLVPIARYRTETFYRLRRPVLPVAIVRHYERLLHGWRGRRQPVDCEMMGLRAGCGALAATFRRADVELTVDVAETLTVPRRAREYELIVSH